MALILQDSEGDGDGVNEVVKGRAGPPIEIGKEAEEELQLIRQIMLQEALVFGCRSVVKQVTE